MENGTLNQIVAGFCSDIDREENGLDLPHLGHILLSYAYYPETMIVNFPILVTGEEDTAELQEFLAAWKKYHQRKYGKPAEATDEPSA